MTGAGFYVARRSRSSGRVLKWLAGPFATEKQAWAYREGWGIEPSAWIAVTYEKRRPAGRAL